MALRLGLCSVCMFYVFFVVSLICFERRMNGNQIRRDFEPAYACCGELQKSTEELTAKLFLKLQSDGSLSQLSPDLRQKLVEYLRNVKINDHKVSETEDLAPKHPLEACNWLIAEHLHRNGYRSTLSVFLIECERSDRTFFNITDILTFIGIDLLTVEATKIVAEYVDRNSKLLFWKILTSNVHKMERLETVSRAIQTESGDGNSETEIETKLQQLDAVYSKRKADLVLRKPSNENFSLLERIARTSVIGTEPYFRNEREMNKKVDNLRTKEMDDYWKAIEERFRIRLDSLIMRERDWTDALEKQKISIEEELYRQRQQILSDLSSLKHRQDDWNDRRSREERDLRVESGRLDEFKREIDDRESAVQEREERYDERLNEQKERLAIEEKRRYAGRLERIQIREKEIEDERKRLFQLEDSLQARRTKYDESATRSTKLQAELENSQREITMLTAREAQEVVLLKEEVKRLRESLGEERQRHADILRTANERAERQQLDIVALKEDLDRLNDERIREKLQYENELRKASETGKSFADRLNRQYRYIAVLNENIESLQRKVKGQRFVTENASEGTPTKHKVQNDSFLNAGIQGIDLNGTYFDTTLNATRLPPELELESREYESQDDDEDISFIQDSRSRIRALEHEAEALEDRYRALKRNDPFSASILTYFQSEACYQSSQKQRIRRDERNQIDFVNEREVLTSTVRDPRQDAVLSEAVLRSEKENPLESVAKPIATDVSVNGVAPTLLQDQALDQLVSDKGLGLVEPLVPHEKSVSQADSPAAAKPKLEVELASMAKPMNLGSTIDLDSVWQRDEDSKSLDDSSSVEDVRRRSSAVPMSSTPYTIKSARNFNNNLPLEPRLKLEGNEEEGSQHIEISGGISDEESRKGDFEW